MKERIYLIPTRYGWMYGLGVFITVLAGVIYSNNLTYLLSFFLVALILIGMIQTHNNMKGLSIERIAIDILPENSRGRVKLWIQSQNFEGHNQILIESISRDKKSLSFTISQLSGKSLISEETSFQSGSRGKFKLGKLRMSTTFPFGLFYAWKSISLDQYYYTYPYPKNSKDLSHSIIYGETFENKIGLKGDDYTQHKKYDKATSPRHIDWKAFAKRKVLLVKEFNDGERQAVLLDFKDTKGSFEDRLRQLSFWIDECESTKTSYLLKIGSFISGPSFGKSQREKCLKQLSVCEEEHVA